MTLPHDEADAAECPAPWPTTRGPKEPDATEHPTPSTEKRLFTEQRHPDAARNIVSTLKPEGVLAKALMLLVSSPAILVLILVIAVLALLIIAVLLPFYRYARLSTLRALCVEENSNHNPLWMLPKEIGDVPPKLRGILYLRLNPFPDNLVTFERGEWDPEKKTLDLKFYSPYTWTIKTNFLVFFLAVGSRIIQYRYRIVFEEDETGNLNEARIHTKIWCLTIPSFIASFHLSDVSAARDGSLWERWNRFVGVPVWSYWAERVVTAGGGKTPFFEHVLDEVQDRCYVVTAKAAEPPPAECAPPAEHAPVGGC